MPVIGIEQVKIVLSSKQAGTTMQVRSGLNIFELTPALLGERLQPTKYVPQPLFDAFLNEAMKRVAPKRLEDGSWFTEIPDFAGIWGSADDLENAVHDLRDALVDWLVVKIEKGDKDIPRIGDLTLNFSA